jgi:hypothetical protein
MTLKVIGSGLGRTGTMSLKLALEQLGLGPCHHMVEVFMHPETAPLWVEAGHGPGDWEKIFDGYQSVVDYPGARFWKELADYYPEARIIHSVRDPGRWFESTQETIFAPGGGPAGRPGPMKEFFEVVTEGISGQLHDRDAMIDHFNRHTETVKATIPPERLLVYEASHGWGPLCAFLGVPVPPREHPRRLQGPHRRRRRRPAGPRTHPQDDGREQGPGRRASFLIKSAAIGRPTFQGPARPPPSPRADARTVPRA